MTENLQVPTWLTGEVAIVTGAGNGIGRGIALLLAAAGAHVVVVDQNKAAADATVSMLEQRRGEALGLDLRDGAAVKGGIDGIAKRHGRIDILVNNAGIYPGTPIDELNDAIWDLTLGVNLRGAFRAMQAAAAHMHEGGRIVNISSIDSLRPSAPGLAHYGASKAALNAVTRSAAVEYGPRGIRVNSLLPGVIITEGTSGPLAQFCEGWIPRTPARRLGTPKDIAGAVLFLVGPLAGFVHGHALVVDGGVTVTG